MDALSTELQRHRQFRGISAGGLDDQDLLRLYRWMQTSRQIDEIERELVARGEAFFHVSSAGHEATAALARSLEAGDYLHCHYRDKALLLARGVPIIEFFNSLLCNASSHSAGCQMSAHLSAPALNVMSIVGPVGNNALQAAGVAHEIRERPDSPIVLCAMGDGTTQQGEVLEAIAEAVRWTLPVLFLIEDNRYSISTQTKGKTFFSLADREPECFYGLPIHRVDGSDPLACDQLFSRLVEDMRKTRAPSLCVMALERLCDHTNADDQSVYRDTDELLHAHVRADPIARLRNDLVAFGMEERELRAIDASIAGEVRSTAELALDRPSPTAKMEARLPLPSGLGQREREYRGSGALSLTMKEGLCAALRARMASDSRVTLYGQDIADPKGDVFGVTQGLSTAFPGRVMNSPLSESTIVGASIGRALAGGRPVAFIQFADFLPLAFNQIASELASIAWRTNGGWKAPVILMVCCGAYRPGLGPFHAQSCESILAHLPGLDVVMPSTGADAAGLLNAAFSSERPTVMLYPKALLNDRSRMTAVDVDDQFVPVGKARIVRGGNDLTIVAWGNTVPLAERIAAHLDSAGASIEVIDLRWLSPWDRELVCTSVRRTRRLMVIHEDNLSAGFGAEVIASVSESLTGEIRCRRVARPDTFIPCHFGNQLEVLPSFQGAMAAAAELLDLELAWEALPLPNAGQVVVEAIGSSPSDQSLKVVELLIGVGDTVRAGQFIASLEADKAVVEVASPANGTVKALHVQIGDHTTVGMPLLTLQVARPRQSQPMQQIYPTPLLKRREATPRRPAVEDRAITVVLTGLGVCRGNTRLDNTELAHRFPELGGTAGIFERTGIESRLVADENQDAVSMAVEAARYALRDANIAAEDISLVICSTSTPTMISPATACQVLQRLAPNANIAAYDLQAACTGYLYALASAWDYLQSHRGRVLVLTTETMRRIVDIDDPLTSPIFGDAATATVLGIGADATRPLAVLHRPVISGHGDDPSTLCVPLPRPGAYVQMDGKRVFGEAVRRMSAMIKAACEQTNLTIDDLDLIVPHQPNGRIIDALSNRLKLNSGRVWNELRWQGNTSSSSIPLALDTVLRQDAPARRIGLCAFGAGFTFGGAILETEAPPYERR
jgi:2-oxoisovalerate dehydrogenase E1 component